MFVCIGSFPCQISTSFYCCLWFMLGEASHDLICKLLEKSLLQFCHIYILTPVSLCILRCKPSSWRWLVEYLALWVSDHPSQAKATFADWKWTSCRRLSRLKRRLGYLLFVLAVLYFDFLVRIFLLTFGIVEYRVRKIGLYSCDLSHNI